MSDPNDPPSRSRGRPRRTSDLPTGALVDQVDAIPAMASSFDPEGRLLHANQEWVDWTGRPLSEERGFGWVTSVHPRHRKTLVAIRREAFTRRAPYEVGYSARRLDGRTMPVVEAAGPPGKVEEPVFICVRSEIPAAHRLPAAEYRDLSPDQDQAGGVIRLGIDGQIRAADRWAVALLGYPDEQAVLELGHARALSREAEWWDRLSRRLEHRTGVVGATLVSQSGDGLDRSLVVDARILRAPGRGGERWAELVVAPVATGGLAEEIEHLRARRIMQETLFRSLAHDLRQPLVAISSLTELLKIPGPVADTTLIAEKISRGAKHIDRIVAGLLDLDRLAAAGTGRPGARVALGPAVTQIVESMSPDRSVTFINEEVFALVDLFHLERMIENLMNNALTHTPEGSPITVRVTSAGGEARIFVEDRGPGVDPGDEEHAFEPFWSGRRSSGMGLGLSIVARFAALNGGRAWVDQRRGGGAAFAVALPLADTNHGGVTP